MAAKKPVAPPAETGPEIISKMAAAPSLDRFFINKPNFTDDELRDFIRASKAERALWEIKQR
jgi:hypothetical protein